MATVVTSRAVSALSTMVAYLTSGSTVRTDAELLLAKTPDQREDIGLTLADIGLIRR